MILGAESTHRVNFSPWGNFYNFSFVSDVSRVREFIQAYTTKGATLTDDLEIIQGHVIFLLLAPCQLLHTLKQRFLLFLMLYGSGKLFQLLANA